MTNLFRNLCLSVCFAAAAASHEASGDAGAHTAATAAATPHLPDWQVLEFEERAFWAVARSRVALAAVPEQPRQWELDVLNSVVSNSEQMVVRFEADSGRVLTRSRVSRGKEQRLKTYQYETDHVLRERRNPGADTTAPASQWPLARREELPYPPATPGATAVISSPYVLLVLAHRLQAQGDDQTQDVLVNTDLNFYRVRLRSGNGVPIDVDYQVSGGERVRGRRETVAVSLQATPAGALRDKADFSLFGLSGDIILFFDRRSGLLLQARGTAPRIGDAAVNLRNVTLRDPLR